MQNLAKTLSGGLAILTVVGFNPIGRADTTQPFVSYTAQDLSRAWTETQTMTATTNPTALYQLFSSSVTNTPPTGGSVRKIDPIKCLPPAPDEDKVLPPECSAPVEEPKAIDNAITVFGVYPLKDEEKSAIVIRMQGFQKYYAAHQEYALYRTDRASVAELSNISKREKYALSDLVMLNARLYYAAPTSAQKCSYIKRVASLYEQFMIRFGSDDPNHFFIVKPNDNDPSAALEFTQEKVLDVLKKEFAAPHVCNFVLQGSRSKQQQAIIDETTRLFTDKVVAEINTYKLGVNEAGTSFTTLKGKLGPDKIKVRTKDILDFERDLLNLESNLKLVSGDDFGVEGKITESKTADVSGGTVQYSVAGCGYLAGVTDYFEQAFDLDPIALTSIIPECTVVGSTAKARPAKGLGSSPEILTLAKKYITEASFAATAQIELLLKFVDEKVVSRPEACPNSNCFTACKALKPLLQKAPGSDRSLLANQLAPLSPGDGNQQALDSQRVFFTSFKTNFDSCMGELKTYLATKADYTADQKFQSAFSTELKRFNSAIK